MTDQLAALALILAMVVWVLFSVVRYGVWCSSCRRVAVRQPHDCSRSTLQLQAAADTIHMTPATELSAALATADTQARTISGLVLPWEEYGDTSVGRVIAGRGSVRLPADVSRIKLMDYHQDPPRAIGYATAAEDTPAGITCTFHVANTPGGDRALLEASERLTDAFSVELAQLQLTGDRIADSYLPSVALLATPAFANARVDSVTAALSPTTKGVTAMTEEQRARLQELLAKSARTAEEEQEYQQLVQLSVQVQVGQSADQGQQQPQPNAAQASAGVPSTQAAAGQLSELAAMMVPQMLAAMKATNVPLGDTQLQAAIAAIPAGLTAGGKQPRPLTDLYAATARVFQGQSKPDMEAALANITQSANPYVTQDEYAGQLWQALDYTRKYVSLLKPGDLKSYKGNGWKWGVAPTMAAYAGDKAAVPSNSPTTVNVPWTASRLAGAHDIDRKYRDFGDEEFFQAYYEAMTFSYALLSDQAARDFVIASATAGAAVTGGLLVGVAKVAARLNAAINDAGVDYILVNDQDKIGLLSVSASSVPAFLEDFIGIKPGQFLGTPAVAAGTIIAGNRNAGQFKELSGVPIRAEVIDMVNGGVDGGVFGYYATVLNMPTAIQKAAWT